MSALARYLPTPRMAHTLLTSNPTLAAFAERQPTRTFAAAAIVMQLRAIRRSEWRDEVEMPVALYQRFPRGLPPRPESLATRASYKLIPDDAASSEAACTSCSVTEGRIFCPSCNGTGTLQPMGDAAWTCGACDGTGRVACSTCDGTRRVMHTTVRYVDDQPISVDLEFVPHLERRISRRIEDAIEPSHVWPEALRFEPQPQVVATAYRGASSVREPDFHGYFFGDALPRAVAALAQVGVENGIMAHEARCFAVPLLWLVYEPPRTRENEGLAFPEHMVRHIAFVARPDGTLATAIA